MQRSKQVYSGLKKKRKKKRNKKEKRNPYTKVKWKTSTWQSSNCISIAKESLVWGKEHKHCHRKWWICCSGVSHWKFWKFSVLLMLFVRFFKKSTFKSNTVLEVKSKSCFAHKTYQIGTAHGSSLSEPLDSQSPHAQGLLRTRALLKSRGNILEGSLRIIYFYFLGLHREKPKIQSSDFSRARSQSVSKQDQKPVMVPSALLEKL